MPVETTSDQTRAARYALGVLTFINLFNYLDRWVMSSVIEPIKAELHVTDAELGLIGTGFIVVYFLTSPIFGTLGDRKKRPPLIALGVAVWSIATTLGGFARGFSSLLLTRSCVGIGEAAYGTIAPALLSDHFPLERRGRIFSIFFAAIPIGSAAGYIVGGLAGAAFGWRAAFWIAGIPGLVLAALVLIVKDAPRGQNDDAPVHAAHAGSLAAYGDLLRNRPYLLAVLGYAAYTFALGGLAFWMPAFLSRVRGMPQKEATVTFGIIAVATGFAGTFSGGWLGDYFLKKSKQSYLWVSGVATLLAAPATYVALTSPNRGTYLPAIVVAEVLIFMSTGPINSAIVNAVAPAERATAVGLSIFIMHLVGDVPSPPLIGWLSDRSSLAQGVLVVPVAILIGGAIWIWAAMARPAQVEEAVR
jgi:MFS transporter, Spinster family, sphingosine-1-phosphate transporter